ncbi:MAG: hypothetical protein ACKVU4_15640 [Phycisphaerales bacterium]
MLYAACMAGGCAHSLVDPCLEQYVFEFRNATPSELVIELGLPGSKETPARITVPAGSAATHRLYAVPCGKRPAADIMVRWPHGVRTLVWTFGPAYRTLQLASDNPARLEVILADGKLTANEY